jgi:hypothetical protein
MALLVKAGQSQRPLWVMLYAFFVSVASENVHRMEAIRIASDGGLQSAGTLLRRDEDGLSELKISSYQKFASEVDMPISCHIPSDATEIPEKAKCPAACPYWAEDTFSGKGCRFKCVTGDQCGVKNFGVDPNATIAEDEHMYCRQCKVAGCSECSRTEKDKCLKCEKASVLKDGKCVGASSMVTIAIYVISGVLFSYLLLWIVDLACRTVTNYDMVSKGLVNRERTKVRQPKRQVELDTTPLTGAEDADPHRPLYPLLTNLLKEPVGGPGTVLHFRFQLAAILWCITVLVMWLVIVHASGSSDVLGQGLEEFETPRDACREIESGYEAQYIFAPFKATFIFTLYIVSFCGCMVFAIWQLRKFQDLDDNATMKDYAALCVGLPRIAGSERVEEDLRQAFETETGQKVVGIVCTWDYSEIDELVTVSVEEMVTKTEGEDEEPIRLEPVTGWGKVRKSLFGRVENVFLWIQGVNTKIEENENGEIFVTEKQVACEEDLHEIYTCNVCIAVFESESARDMAIATSRAKAGVPFKGSRLRMQPMEAEPQTVHWDNFCINHEQRSKRIVRGVLILLGSLAVWTVAIYLPMAVWQSSFSYENGDTPGGFESMFFTVVLAIINVTMYFVCAAISEYFCFWFEDTRECSYMVMYTIAILLNTALDVVVAGHISYAKLLTRNVHTYGGERFSQLRTFQEVFDSYPMQKEMLDSIWEYSYPGTILLPYFLEPCLTIILPYLLAKRLVSTRIELKGHQAEKALAIFTPMDTGRYADVVINITLGSLAFFVPSGLPVKMFGLLIGAHIWIFIMDTYRVLRCVPAFNYSGHRIEKCAQRLLGIPIGILLCAGIWKVNCVPGKMCLSGPWLSILCIDVFLLHMMVHLACIEWLVPKFAKKDHDPVAFNYDAVAAAFPATYFSTNPVHVLRSKLIYRQKPPVSFYIPGKEHMMKKNPAAGTYFEGFQVSVQKTI